MARRIYDGRTFVPAGPTAFTKAADGLEVFEVGIADPYLIPYDRIPGWLLAHADYITWATIVNSTPASAPAVSAPVAPPPVYVTPQQPSVVYTSPPPPVVILSQPVFPWGRWGRGPFSGPFGLGGRGGLFGGGLFAGGGLRIGGRAGGGLFGGGGRRGPYINIV
jgi:hypothetical protein